MRRVEAFIGRSIGGFRVWREKCQEELSALYFIDYIKFNIFGLLGRSISQNPQPKADDRAAQLSSHYVKHAANWPIFDYAGTTTRIKPNPPKDGDENPRVHSSFDKSRAIVSPGQRKVTSHCVAKKFTRN